MKSRAEMQARLDEACKTATGNSYPIYIGNVNSKGVIFLTVREAYTPDTKLEFETMRGVLKYLADH